jgi:hypothetical protein
VGKSDISTTVMLVSSTLACARAHISTSHASPELSTPYVFALVTQVAPNYYSLSLAERAQLLGCKTEQLTKVVLLRNSACTEVCKLPTISNAFDSCLAHTYGCTHVDAVRVPLL